NAYLQEHIVGIAVLHLFNREKKSCQEFDQINRQHMAAFKDTIVAYGWFYPVVEFLSALALASILTYVGWWVERGGVTIGVAVVGHTGAGKTTLISLLLRFYDIQKGAIRIGGVDIRHVDPLELRRRFGVVLQDPYLFTGSIEDNIRLGTDGITREEIVAAAEQVNLMDFIHSLPDGFAQPIRERGSSLST